MATRAQALRNCAPPIFLNDVFINLFILACNTYRRRPCAIFSFRIKKKNNEKNNENHLCHLLAPNELESIDFLKIKH